MKKSEKRRALEEETPRPLCGCGKNPATHVLTLTVQRLKLDREPGIRSDPYWTMSYRDAHTGIQSLVCDECVRNNINVTVAVSASVEKAKETL